MKSQTLLAIVLTAVCCVGMAGCVPEGRGFKLPDGSPEAGRETFVSLQCSQCHSVGDIQRSADSETGIDIRLGGPVARVRTYGELVTSVINPSHRIAQQYPAQPVEVEGQSAMRNYNSVMTVQQLVDLVTLLETEYDLRIPPSYL